MLQVAGGAALPPRRPRWRLWQSELPFASQQVDVGVWEEWCWQAWLCALLLNLLLLLLRLSNNPIQL